MIEAVADTTVKPKPQPKKQGRDMTPEKVAVVTGANRGIGFEFVKQLSDAGWHVFAGYRNEKKSTELLDFADKSSHVHAVKFDVVDQEALQKLHDEVNKEFSRLDLLVNNAGVNLNTDAALDELSEEDFVKTFEINVLGCWHPARILRPLLAKADRSTVVNIGSGAGSLSHSEDKANRLPSYRVSKAALNMMTLAQAQEYKDDDIIVVCMSPGWVKTDMGGQDADLTTEESVEAMLKTINSLSPSDSGRFMKRDGEDYGY